MTLPPGGALGSTSDPAVLIQGDPDQVLTQATTLLDESTRITELADEVAAIRVRDWSGGFGEPAYRAASSDEAAKWRTYGDLLQRAGSSLTTYAAALRAAQDRAAEAISLWQAAQAATERAVVEHDAAVAAYNAALTRPVCLPSYGSRPTPPSATPARPGPFVDPGAPLREEAAQVLEQARSSLEDAGATAVKELGGLEGGRVEGSTDGPSAHGSVEGPSIDWGDWEDTFGRDGATGPHGDYDRGGSDSPFAINLGSVEGRASLWGAEGTWEDYWGGARVHADGSVTALGVRGGATGSIGSDGLVLAVEGRATLVGAEGAVGIEGEHASAELSGEAFAGALAESEMLLGPTGAHAGGELFAGAQVESGLKGDVGGVGGEVEGELWAGWGVAGDIDFGLRDGKFEIGGSGGVGVGLGGKVGGHVTIDPVEVLQTGGALVIGIGELFE